MSNLLCNTSQPDIAMAKTGKNTDRELFRERLNDPLDPGDVYSPSIHVTQNGMIGMSVGGRIIQMSIRDWFKAARSLACSECGQMDTGQHGEYPCPKCGLPTCW